MRAIAVCGLVLIASACQPQVERSAVVVTDAVLVRQSASQLKEDAVRTLLSGEWHCTGVASGINITMDSNFLPGGVIQSVMKMVSPDMDLTVTVSGKWVVKAFTLQQSYSTASNLSGTLNGGAVTPEDNAKLRDAILELAPDAEAIELSDHKFTLTDGQGTVTTCTQ